MRVSRLFGNTLKELPTSFEGLSQKYLIKAGYIRLKGNHLIGFPIYAKTIQMIRNLINNHLENPQQIKLSKSLEKNNNTSILDIICREINSYKQLPVNLYIYIQINSYSNIILQKVY